MKLLSDSMLMPSLESVTTVLTDVMLVPCSLTTVLNVSHQESELQNVSVQMVLMITVTLVLVVPITVLPVKTEKLVYLAQSEELWSETNVNV